MDQNEYVESLRSIIERQVAKEREALLSRVVNMLHGVVDGIEALITPREEYDLGADDSGSRVLVGVPKKVGVSKKVGVLMLGNRYDQTLELLKRGAATASSVSSALGIKREHAAIVLSELTKRGQAKRIARGVYELAANEAPKAKKAAKPKPKKPAAKAKPAKVTKAKTAAAKPGKRRGKNEALRIMFDAINSYTEAGATRAELHADTGFTPHGTDRALDRLAQRGLVVRNGPRGKSTYMLAPGAMRP